MIEQGIIVACGATSIWLSQDPRDSRRRWACLIALSAQPFWLYATWHTEQWGIFALAIAYTIGWARGFYTYWVAT